MDKKMLNAAANGNILTKEASKAFKLIEETAQGDQIWDANADFERGTGRAEGDEVTKLAAELAALRKEIAQSKNNGSQTGMQRHIMAVCDHCGDNHNHFQCPSVLEEVNYLGNQNRQVNDPYSNTYNLGWRSHPNFSWRNGNGQEGPS